MGRVREHWLAIGLVVLITLITFGVLIPQLGWYRDDWYVFLTQQYGGIRAVINLYTVDRPVRGYMYAAGMLFLPGRPLPWQLATLFFRLAGNLAFLWVLRMIWPEKKKETLAAALLFSIYPGYVQEPNASVFINDLIDNAFALTSIGLTIVAMRSPRWWVKIVTSLVGGFLMLSYIGILEGAIGLEAARFGILWYLIWMQDRASWLRTIWRTIKADVWYLLLAAGFLYWRLFIFHGTRRATNLDVLVGNYSRLPLYSLLGIAAENVKDMLETAFFAWIVPFYQYVARSNYRDLAIAVILALGVVGLVWLALRWRERSEVRTEAEGGEEHPERVRHMILMGAWIVFFGLLPINLANRDVLFSDQWDRYTIYAAVGAAILMSGLIYRYVRGQARTTLLLILLGLSVVTHYFSAAWYRDFWARERDMWQQLVWRAPAIQRGAMLFAVLPAGGFEEGYELYGPANMIYYPGEGVQIGGGVVNADTATDLQLQKNRDHTDRGVIVQDNYKQALIMAYPSPQSCLHVLDGRKVEMPGLLDDSILADVATYSHIDQIQDASTPPRLPDFMRIQPREWCYYYQKMDLARQMGEWQKVADLADEAARKGLKPEDVSELMPALEAYATLGRLQDARHVASIIRSNDSARSFLCLQMQRGAAYPAPYRYAQVNDILCQAASE